ncbi:conserved protein, unknown function [Plasmodium gallinaceum]|uniref:Telomere length and silencing protein 1 n=1 Tax=Plasmodium gallinaceum TaxID=5849 RepID=A0A1J1GQU1_PLAGA|nr:conserved protein, unknown function [Plasmodium gallinaceum]CRG94879.1 conserved protein, unknown function [Plasmodium gallinaceum]
MIKKRKLKTDNKCMRIPLEKDEDLKIQESTKNELIHKNFKILKLETSKNLKLLQNIRLKKKGINADNIIYESKVLEKNEKEKKLLDKQFTKNITEKEIEDAHVESFIRENMKEFYEEKDEKKKKKEEQDDIVKDLYKISDHLKVKSSINDNSEKLNCITGITEIPLPLEIKLKNIEETEKIKRKFLRNAKFLNTESNN